MIPLQLTFQNFLSYREATLDFRGLHTACICGANGAGKSSLLEAITWAIWGQSRTVTEDDVIHAGTNDVRVDFEFISNNQTYRIIRSRQRGKSSLLEFQVETESGKFRSLTAKGVRATQELIISYLKLDYDTFINSAYLRQGRADEFMLRRPSDRKQILADLLKLDRYEQLADRAKDLSKQYKGQAEQLEQSLQPIEEQLEQRKEIVPEKNNLEAELVRLEQLQEAERKKLEQLQAIAHQRQTWEQQVTWQQTQYQNLSQDCDRLSKDISSVRTQQNDLQKLLNQETEITAGYNGLLHLQEQEKIISAKLEAYQDAQQEKRELEQQLIQETNELNIEIRSLQTRLETLQQQEKEIEEIIASAAEVEAALTQLKYHRERLNQLDRLQEYVAPLIQQRRNLQSEIERAQTRLSAKLEQLRSQESQFSLQIAQLPQMRQTVLAVDEQIEELEKKRVYKQRVEEKGKERREFQTRLQENQRVCEQQLGELKQKLQMLQTPDVACPLCEQELDEHHRLRVIQKTENQHQEIQEQFWVIREQMAVCERELQVLRAEYRELDEKISSYDSLQKQLGQLEAQLEATGEIRSQLQQIKEEMVELERSLVIGDYASELQSELNSVESELKRLNYDEQTHALVRGEEKRWRWAEIKSAKIEDAQRRQAVLNKQKPELEARIVSLRASLERLRTDSEIQRQIERIDGYINQLGYSSSHHKNLLASLRQAQSWQLKDQQLQQAKQQYPQLQARIQQLEELLQERLDNKTTRKRDLESLIAQMEAIEDNSDEIRLLEQQIYQRRRNLDRLLSDRGRLQQSLIHLDNLQTQYDDICKQLKEVRKNYRVYQELGQAFGKNGIQALMIENVLPQLEAETNQILARLTGNQLHVQFLTQRAGKSSRAKKETAKLIDTLDILIADAQGTRPYETYSGGEAFRINFSIRLALARMLAQRAGTSLQMLIVDEGFGTQDAEGCDRLIAAINAIASDFACILTVTHMPQFKEAFQTRIEVYKSDRGSQLILSN